MVFGVRVNKKMTHRGHSVQQQTTWQMFISTYFIDNKFFKWSAKLISLFRMHCCFKFSAHCCRAARHPPHCLLLFTVSPRVCERERDREISINFRRSFLVIYSYEFERMTQHAETTLCTQNVLGECDISRNLWWNDKMMSRRKSAKINRQINGIAL